MNNLFGYPIAEVESVDAVGHIEFFDPNEAYKRTVLIQRTNDILTISINGAEVFRFPFDDIELRNLRHQTQI